MRWLTGLMAPVLLLTACGGNDPVPTDTGARTLSGQLQPWDAQNPWATLVRPVNAAVETPQTDFTAPVNQAGQFDLPLPSIAAMNSTYKDDLMTLPGVFAACGVNQSESLPDLKLLPLNKLETEKGTPLVMSSNGGTTFKTWWYADRDASVKINVKDCLGISSQSTLNLKAGWNVVDQTLATAPDNTVTLTYTNGEWPSGRTVWTQQGSMGLLGVQGDFLTTWRRQAR